MGKRPTLAKPPFVAASKICCVLNARRAASEVAPSSAANFAPDCSARASGTGESVPITEPLSPMAPAIRSLDRGEAICALTEMEPADSPAIVTRRGSPPKAAMLSCTQRRAALWSRRA